MTRIKVITFNEEHRILDVLACALSLRENDTSMRDLAHKILLTYEHALFYTHTQIRRLRKFVNVFNKNVNKDIELLYVEGDENEYVKEYDQYIIDINEHKHKPEGIIKLKEFLHRMVQIMYEASKRNIIYDLLYNYKPETTERYYDLLAMFRGYVENIFYVYRQQYTRNEFRKYIKEILQIYDSIHYVLRRAKLKYNYVVKRIPYSDVYTYDFEYDIDEYDDEFEYADEDEEDLSD